MFFPKIKTIIVWSIENKLYCFEGCIFYFVCSTAQYRHCVPTYV